LPRLEAADLLGARGLALAGGVVTLLGIVFFFALAASNGWIGPVARVLLGGAASALALAAGVVVQARFGKLYAAVAAAGAGISGGYATLLFAAARYELVSPLGALALAAGIATLGVALALRWSSEIVASLGLIGAMAVPAVALLDDDATTTGTAFVAIVLLGSILVALRQRWDALLVFAGAVSLPQLAILVLQEGEPARARVLVVAAAFGLLYLGGGVVRQLLADGLRLDALAGTLAGANVALTLFSSFLLLDGNARGIALTVAAAVYAAVAVGLRREVELSSLGAAAASALAAVALAQFLDGPALVVAWAAETVALAWLGRRIADIRFQLLAFAYLVLAAVYALVVEAAPDLLYTRGADHLAAVPALLAVAAGAIGYGLLAGSWPPARDTGSMPAFLADVVRDFHHLRRELRIAVLALGALVTVDAASLATLDVAGRLELAPAFEWGHVGVTALWALVSLGALVLGLVRRRQSFEIAALVGLGASLASFELFAVPELGAQREWAALVLCVGLAAAALLHGLLSGAQPLLAGVAVAFSGLLAAFAATELFDGDAVGYALVVGGAVFTLVAAAVFRWRDAATPFWLAGVLLGLAGALLLVDGNWLVLALTVAAAALALVGVAVGEPRLWVAAAGLTLLGAAVA
ncbi:MAG TPA: DUF2339 domain-containing protein, partial [Gaiellaceae bacterium]|nr:DUF2339 domain-containing protein [Gaiellaceae bacterium]